jgi:hypothetical protein
MPINNIEQRTEYMKNYRANHPETKTCQEERVKCSCGSVVRRDGMSAHKKTQKHINSENKMNAMYAEPKVYQYQRDQEMYAILASKAEDELIPVQTCDEEPEVEVPMVEVPVVEVPVVESVEVPVVESVEVPVVESVEVPVVESVEVPVVESAEVPVVEHAINIPSISNWGLIWLRMNTVEQEGKKRRKRRDD